MDESEPEVAPAEDESEAEVAPAEDEVSEDEDVVPDDGYSLELVQGAKDAVACSNDAGKEILEAFGSSRVASDMARGGASAREVNLLFEFAGQDFIRAGNSQHECVRDFAALERQLTGEDAAAVGDLAQRQQDLADTTREYGRHLVGADIESERWRDEWTSLIDKLLDENESVGDGMDVMERFFSES